WEPRPKHETVQRVRRISRGLGPGHGHLTCASHAPHTARNQREVERLAAWPQAADGPRRWAGGLEADVGPDAAAPTRSHQYRREGRAGNVIVFSVYAVPPPTHGSSHRPPKSAAPQPLAETPEERVVRPVPTAPVRSELVDQYWLVVTLQEGLSNG